MKRYLLLTIAVVIVSGCAANRDVVLLEDRVGRLERSLKEQEKDQPAEEDLRSKIADMRLDMNQLHETVNQLNGRIEEADYFSKNKSGPGESGSTELNLAQETLDQMAARIARIEQYLGFEGALPAATLPVAPEDGARGVSSEAPSGKNFTEKEAYEAAKNLFDQGDTEAAREGFNAYLKKYPKSDNADNAQFWIGEIYYREKWYEKAILEYQKVIDKYPKGNKVPAAYLKQAYAFQNMGEAGNAKLLLKELIGKFPDSTEAKIAAEKVKELN